MDRGKEGNQRASESRRPLGRPQGCAKAARKELELRLAESERLTSMLGELAKVGAWKVDTASGQARWSAEVAEIHGREAGYSPSVEEGIEYYAPEHRPLIRAAVQRCVEEGKPFDEKLDIITAQGRRVPVRAIGRAARDEEGRITSIEGAFQDLSEIERWQRDLRERDAQLEEALDRMRNILESITDAFFALDRSWNFTYVNSEAERLLRLDRKELLGRCLWEVFPEAVGTVFEENYRRAMEQSCEVSFVAHYDPLDLSVEVNAYPSDEGLTIYFRDVGEKLAAAERLRRQAWLLDQTRDAVFVVGEDGRITYWNRAASTLYGWSREEAMEQPSIEFLFTRAGDLQRALEATRQQGDWHGDLEQVTREGKALVVEGRWALLRREGMEGYEGFLAVNTDVTDRRKLEAQFLRAQRMEGIGSLAGGIAHDLNNVLAPVLLSIGTLRLSRRSEEEDAVLETIETAIRRGSETIGQLLNFARGVGGKRAAIHPRQLLRELNALLKQTFPRSIEVAIEVDQDIVLLRGDMTELHQALLNLCINARDAMPSGGKLTLSARSVTVSDGELDDSEGSGPGRYVALSVSDTGHGIAASIRDKLFDPFFTTKEVGSGTGLGLPSVIGIVKGHGGFVRVESEEGKGATFSLMIPVAPVEDAGPERSEEDEPARTGDGELVLLVDDEESVRSIGKRTLEAFGYKVLVAENGVAGLTAFCKRRGEVAVVITDMMMPVMDGPALIHALRGMEPDLPIVGISGLLEERKRFASGRDRPSCLLDKPFSANALLSAMAEALGKGPAAER